MSHHIKIGEVYQDVATGEKFRVFKIHDYIDSAEAMAIENHWDVIGIRQSDIDDGKFKLYVEPVKGKCYSHDWVLYTGFRKMLWYCKHCNEEKEYTGNENQP